MENEKSLRLPERVKICPVCSGKGQYEQTYTAGCGKGSYVSMGPCDYCKHDQAPLMRGLGYIMKDRSRVPESVINQIELMNKHGGAYEE